MAGNDAYTKLLLHFDGDIADSSASGIEPTKNINVTLNSGDSKFGSAGCAGFDTIAWGTGGVLTFPYDINLVIGTSSFTLDFWAKDLFVDHAYCGFTFLEGAAEKISFRLNTTDQVSKFKFFIGSTEYENGVTTNWSAGITKTYTGIEPYYYSYAWSIFNPRTWNHFALCVGEGYAELFINGVSQGNQALVENSSSYNKPELFSVYGDGWSTPSFQTLLEEYRLSIGTKRWTAGFTPPTEPYSAPDDPKLTKLILSMNGGDESQAFTDSSAAPHTIITNGGVKQDTGWYQLGTASAQFDTSNDYLSITDDLNWEIFNKPFTIHFWFKPVSVTGEQTIFKQLSHASTYMICSYNHDTGIINFEVKIWDKQRIYIKVAANLVLGAFTHIAIVGR